jgi:hypothetical protein
MNRKQLTLLMVLGIVAAGLWFVTARRDAASYQTSSAAGIGQKVIPNLAINDVAHIVIRHQTNEVNLIKGDEDWKIRERYDYPANFQEIGDLVRKIWELKIVQTEEVGASQLPRLELLEPGKGTNSGTQLEFKDKSGKSLASVLLGKKHMRKGSSPSQFGDDGWPAGRYLLSGNSKNVALVSDALSEVEPKPDRWLSKNFFKVEKLKTAAVTHTNATNSWKLSRETETGELKLADLKEGEQQDTGKSSGAGWVLSSPSFVDVVSPDAKPDETGMDNPVLAKLETFEGFAYTVKIGRKTAEDNYYLAMNVTADFPKERTPVPDEKAEDKEKLDKEFKEKQSKFEEKLKQEKAFEKWTYLVSKWTIDALLKERKDLLTEKKEESKTDAKPGETSAATPPTPDVSVIPPLVPGAPEKKDGATGNP